MELYLNKIKEKLLSNPSRRISLLKLITVGGLIAGMVLSTKLWFGKRFFPKVPVFNGLPTISPTVETALFILLFTLLAAILTVNKPGKLTLGALAIMAVFALFDQMRWQPWVYQYFIMLFVLGVYFLHDKSSGEQGKALNTIRLMVAGIYFFSGLQKLNPEFINNVFPWMVEPVATLLPASMYVLIYPLGIAVPFVEMGIGVGLLTKKFRSYAVGLALLMVVFVLFTLGPWGHDWNSVVWPWNIAMAFMVVTLFWEAKHSTLKDVFKVKNFPLHKVVLVLFIIMPLFSFAGLWDSYLSSSLYSGNTKNAKIIISDSAKKDMPTAVQKHTPQTEKGKNVLNINQWSFEELNVPPYPETRVYKGIGRDLCRQTDNEGGITLVVEDKSLLLGGIQKSEYGCAELQKELQ